ncbi:MAG: hypothetical protein ABF335_08785 [Alphaproteobacteria bacterium]
MFNNPSLMTRIAVGKSIGFLIGLLGFIAAPYFMPDVDPMLRWGLLFWYTTVGAVIGLFGVFTYHPLLQFPLPWWFRSALMGGWMNFVLVFFAHEKITAMLVAVLGEGSAFTSPFMIVPEGVVIGLLIGFCATKIGGEGKATVPSDI